MSSTTVLFVVLGVLLALFVLCVVLFLFSVELLRNVLRRTPLAPLVARGRARGNYGASAEDGD